MGGSSSSSASSAATDGKFIKIGEEFVGEEEKTFNSVNIYQVRFLKSKVIDRVIVQLRLEVKVGSLVWTILRSLEDFRLLKESLKLPAEFPAPFPKTDQRCFPDDSEIVKIQMEISKWLMAALGVGHNLPPLLAFLGVMDGQINETAKTRMDLDTLISTCDTGDILLFRTHGFIPASIRRITSSKYDHVGVVVVRELEGGGRGVCFLEASGDSYGVNMHSMRTRLVEWYLADAKICYRRLRCVRDTRFKIRTKSFIERVQGLKYGYSIKSLVLNQKDQWPAVKSKFFCSELVTAFYKHLGFIQSFAKSHTYMPGDFAEKGAGARLNLVDAILEHEVMVTKWPKRSQAIITPIKRRTPKQSKLPRERSQSLTSICLKESSTFMRRSSTTQLRRNRSYSTCSLRLLVNEVACEKFMLYPYDDEVKTAEKWFEV